MASGAVLQPEYIPRPGGISNQHRGEAITSPWRGIGVLYVREDAGGLIEFRVLYESQVSDAVKTEMAARFGVGAIEWKVCS